MPAPSLANRRRRAARLALYAALAALVVGLLALTAAIDKMLEFRARWAGTDWSARPEVELLREYVRLPTVAGQETLGAEFLAEKLEEIGVEVTLEPLGDGHANLWAILEGEDPEALVLHHHIDVTSVDDADDWLHPPFGAEIEGPWLYGRGVFDMKSYAIAQLMAFIEVARSGRPLKRSLMLLATSDEESASRLGTQWLLSQHPELADRMWGVLTEGGVVEALSPDDIKYWGVEAFQFQIVRARACSPSRDRLEDLLDDLAAWPATELPLEITPELETFFADYAPTRSRRLTRVNLSYPHHLRVNRRGYNRLPQFARDLMRSTTAPWPVQEDPGGGYSVAVNLLLAPGNDPDEAIDRLLPGWLRHGVSWQIGRPEGAAHGSSTSHPIFTTAIESLRAASPGTPVGSFFLPYNLTDARFFRLAGIPSYGFSPFLFFATDTVRADRTNERIPLPGFVAGVETYTDTVRRLVLGPEN